MKRTFAIGLWAAIVGGLGLWVGAALGLSFQSTIMCVGGGVIAAVVQIGSPLARLCGFLIGYLLGVFFTIMQLGLLPGGSSVVGGAVGLVVIMIIITLVSGFTRDRISAWTMLLGAMVFVAGFLPVTTTAPWTASQQLGTYFFTLLAMAAVGFLTVIPGEWIKDTRAGYGKVPPATTAGPSTPPPLESSAPEGAPQSQEAVTAFDDILGGTK